MTIRSGRFKVSGTLPIIAGVSNANASYRIFNSGISLITVTAGAAAPKSVKLWPACSVDVAAGDVTVSASTATEGIYDYLATPEPIRSGRFQFRNAAESDITIVQGRTGVFYRILNSGEQDFVIKPKGASTPPPDQITLSPTFSIDVTSQSDIVIAGEAGKAVEGIYEYLDPQVSARSGRFKISQNPQNEHKIIDLSGAASSKAWYRIFNSGEYDIVVVGLAELGKEQSFDFEVGSSVKQVFVKSKSDAEPIEGIYEFLGRG